MDLYSRHTLKNQIYDIRQNEQLRMKYWNHNLRTAFEYNLDDEDHLISLIPAVLHLSSIAIA